MIKYKFLLNFGLVILIVGILSVLGVILYMCYIISTILFILCLGLILFIIGGVIVGIAEDNIYK